MSPGLSKRMLCIWLSVATRSVLPSVYLPGPWNETAVTLLVVMCTKVQAIDAESRVGMPADYK